MQTVKAIAIYLRHVEMVTCFAVVLHALFWVSDTVFGGVSPIDISQIPLWGVMLYLGLPIILLVSTVMCILVELGKLEDISLETVEALNPVRYIVYWIRHK